MFLTNKLFNDIEKMNNIIMNFKIGILKTFETLFCNGDANA